MLFITYLVLVNDLILLSSLSDNIVVVVDLDSSLLANFSAYTHQYDDDDDTSSYVLYNSPG
jgi:hypothetical protein